MKGNRKTRRLFLLLVSVVAVSCVVGAVYWWWSWYVPRRRVNSLLAEITDYTGGRESGRPVTRSNEDAFRELVDLGEAAVPALVEALHHEKEKVRWRAVLALGEIGDERAVIPLCDVMRNDEHINTRAAAIGALGRIRSEDAIAGLCSLLDSAHDKTIVNMLNVVREGTLSYTVEVPIRALAARELGWIGGERAITALADATRDKDSRVSAYAWHALADTNADRAMKILLRRLRTAPSNTKCRIAMLLGGTDRKDVVEPLIEALEHGTSEAVIGLGEIGDPRGIEPAITASRHEDSNVRLWAVEALGKLGGSLSLQRLKVVAEDAKEEEKVREAARDVIRRQPG